VRRDGTITRLPGPDLPVALRKWDLDAGLAQAPAPRRRESHADALRLSNESTNNAQISKSNALSPKPAKYPAQYPGGGGTGM
jgi:hypothetical protein